jgi:hypothetical protein
MFDFGNLSKVIQGFQNKISLHEKKLIYIEQNLPNIELSPRNINKVVKDENPFEINPTPKVDPKLFEDIQNQIFALEKK